MRPKLALEQPGKSMGELSKMLGPEWQQTSPESREKYEELAKADRERYETEVEQFNANRKEMLRVQAEQRAAEEAAAKERKVAIKKYKPLKLTRPQSMLLAVEEMRAHEDGLRAAAEARKARRSGTGAAKRPKVAEDKPDYHPIRANAYLCQKPKLWKEEERKGQACQCDPTMPCVDDLCVNRAMYWECGTQNQRRPQPPHF